MEIKYTLDSKEKSILITGGAGFIGSHLVRKFVMQYPEYHIVNVDALTYAGNLQNVADVRSASNYTFVKCDIRDLHGVNEIFAKHEVTDVIHCAAESHVDRSIHSPLAFVETNIIGTVNLLRAAQDSWEGGEHRFHHVSTDEVFGSLGDEGLFTEDMAYDPRSPYSASKASSDHFVRAWHHTYGLPVLITNCSNNYGPYQFPEKLIPLMIRNAMEEVPLPIYGDGSNVRDWLHVHDHVRAIDTVFHQGKVGATYNVGGDCERANIDVVKAICALVDEQMKRPPDTSVRLIEHIDDRAGHDFRYAMDFSKLSKELGWSPSLSFEEGLESTVKWYFANKSWVQQVTSGAYLSYYKQQYGEQ